MNWRRKRDAVRSLLHPGLSRGTLRFLAGLVRRHDRRGEAGGDTRLRWCVVRGTSRRRLCLRLTRAVHHRLRARDAAHPPRLFGQSVAAEQSGARGRGLCDGRCAVARQAGFRRGPRAVQVRLRHRQRADGREPRALRRESGDHPRTMDAGSRDVSRTLDRSGRPHARAAAGAAADAADLDRGGTHRGDLSLGRRERLSPADRAVLFHRSSRTAGIARGVSRQPACAWL